MKFTIKKDRLLMILLYFLIKVSLDFMYCSYIVPLWGYMGFVLSKSFSAYVISFIYVFLLSISVPVKVKKTSDLFLHILALCPLIPMLTIYAFSFATHEYMAVCILSFFIILICVNFLFPSVSPKTLYKGYKIAFGISIFFIFLVTLHIISLGGLRFFNLKLSKVYEFRRASAHVVAQGLYAYLNNWVFKVFNMFIFTWSLYKNKKLLIAISLILQVFFFAVSAHKSVLFFPLVIVLIKYISQKKRLSLLLPTLYLLGSWFSLTIYSFFNNIWPLSLYVRRLLFVPAFLNFKYFAFFQNNPMVYFSNSFLKKFINYPYDIAPPLLVSTFIGQNPQAWANTGFLGTGYAHMGYWGIVFYAFLLGLVLKFTDDTTYNKLPLWVGSSLIAVPIITVFMSSDLTTGLLTHGLALAVFLLWLAKTANLNRAKEKIFDNQIF
ncbi:hypothetical protein [Aminobacterium mobile]|uniref:hypothetical protein n=1 Tax=Aminobacterium mobile TaxID=81467 RepID=UPI000463FC21|nr:hypothetical protein [Aminobacterium mobile]